MIRRLLEKIGVMWFGELMHRLEACCEEVYRQSGLIDSTGVGVGLCT